MDAAAIIESLGPLVAGASLEPAASVDGAVIYVDAAHLVATCAALRDTLGFDLLAEVTAVDWLPREPRFEVVYQLVATEAARRVRLKVRTATGEAVPTVQAVWRSAGWPEREVYDTFGIVFDGHPDLRRILMPEDWEGHPLRKDYPVQIRKTAQTYEPLEVTEHEFRANLEADRYSRKRPQ